ncbi:MAG TPA: NAD(P)H-dependent oxidoreductase subunit E [Syntrophobacteraceae bacterium]|nr:NAD(P)H-dependent oxidoreductase subunit E [Syntrophobacteraceae bacterium]
MSLSSQPAAPFGFLTSNSPPGDWIEQHRQAHQHYRGPRDTRIPPFLGGLAQAVSTLRFSLMQLRLALERTPSQPTDFRRRLLDSGMGLHGEDPEGHLVKLVDNYLSRRDWREQDILEMILEYLERSSPREGELAGELARLRSLRERDRERYQRVVPGMMSEARGNLMGLGYASRFLQDLKPRFPKLNRGALEVLTGALRMSLGLPRGAIEEIATRETPADLWSRFYKEAGAHWTAQGTFLTLKPFEKASLYLMESLPIEKRGHSGFVRYLLENEAAYRRILAACYASPEEQQNRLLEETDRYNRLPEHALQPAAYDEEERALFLYAFFLRPDVVEAIAERERHKDLYQAVPGLPSRALLPRVLQEVQNVFGYITPESFEKIVEILELPPVEVIRVIASYKQYSADPGGDILIYVCKGTACFLRGQPNLSRSLSSHIRAEQGEVGEHGIQFIEMDCFGVCHLAPVIKSRDTFLGNRTARDIPRMLDQLLKGPEYDNRLSFIRRIQQELAPGRTSDLPDTMRILRVEGNDGAKSPSPGTVGEGPIPSEKDLGGAGLRIDSDGRVHAVAAEGSRELGRVIPSCLPFHYTGRDGSVQVGCVVLDEFGQATEFIHVDADFLGDDLRRTMKPAVRVTEGKVWIERNGPFLCLGDYIDQAVAVRSETGAARLVVLSGTPGRTPPAREEGVARGSADGEDAGFAARQDRLVLGFAALADPQDIDSYLAVGGYGAVRRVLGLEGEPAWAPRDIVREVSAARLRGRGGAGFPTGTKWEAVRLARCVVEEGDHNRDPIKFIVANGDEGDPGAFMDRTLIQERPHQVLEGMILAALAVGARYGVLYVRKEYEDAVRRLEHAVFQARRKGFLGRNIFGTPGLCFDIDIRLGAGAFVAGEKRAIMRAIEGEPAEPTLNAVSNTFRGLWGKPTLLNNVETLANVPLILRKGSEWYASRGTENSGGSKIFSVAGIVNRTGLVEVRFGRTLDDIIRICGGVQDGKRLAGVQIGGPSGAILSLTGVRSYLLYTPLDFDTFDRVGAMLGSGGLVFIGDDDDVVRLARHFTDWLAEESCGQCPSCLQGTASLGSTLDSILAGEGTADHIHALWAKSDAIKAGSQCGLGMTAANPVTSALRFFPHSFLYHALANPRLNRQECFLLLEALRLLTREDVQRITGRRRETLGYSFTLKKHLARHLMTELDRLDQVHPGEPRRVRQLLDLLQVPPHEMGTRDISHECSLEELEDHRRYLEDWAGDPEPPSASR